MTAVQTAAREAYAAGLCVVPPREDGSKRPIGEWKAYQRERPARETMRAWYGTTARTGLGVICGAVSGGLEVLECDERAASEAFRDLARQAGLGDVLDRLEAGYVEETPGDGVHWLYRCNDLDGNTKLACRPKRADEQRDAHDTIKTLIETRGEGGYCILAPSNGQVHPSGRAYVLRAGGFATIPTLTPEERRELHQIARALDALPKAPDAACDRPLASTAARSDRPGDDFAARASWGEVLEPHGWRPVYTRDSVTHWRRPGKDRGTSATTNHGGSDLLYVFSSSTPFERERGYNKFSAYALLAHAGDFAAAARALAGQGYGASATSARPARGGPADPDAGPAETGPFARRLPDLIADLARVPDAPPLIEGFVPAEVITLLHGQPRDWKTIVALHVAIAAATGRPLFGLPRLAVPAPRHVLYLTEEDGARRVTDRLRMICAGLGCLPPATLFVRAGTGFSLDDPDGVAHLIAFVRDASIGVVIPDPLRSLSGCVDQGPKELRPLTLTLRRLMRETGCTIFAVHHDSKPLAIGVDVRRRPQRASGGAVFSIADAPIGIDPLPDGRRLLTPTAWKFSDDPASVVVALEAGDGWLRLVGAEADGATTASEADLGARVLAFLADHPRVSGAAVQKAIKGRRADVYAALDRLARTGAVDSVQAGRSALWFRTDEIVREPYGNHRFEAESGADSTVPAAGTIPPDGGNPEGSMVPDGGNRSEPYTGSVPATGEVPGNGSRSCTGTVPGNHATGDRERSLAGPAVLAFEVDS